MSTYQHINIFIVLTLKFKNYCVIGSVSGDYLLCSNSQSRTAAILYP